MASYEGPCAAPGCPNRTDGIQPIPARIEAIS